MHIESELSRIWPATLPPMREWNFTTEPHPSNASKSMLIARHRSFPACPYPQCLIHMDNGGEAEAAAKLVGLLTDGTN